VPEALTVWVPSIHAASTGAAKFFTGNQSISYYEGEGPRDMPHGIPAEEHVVVTRAGNGDAVQAAVSPRAVKRLGAFPPRDLEFFLVSDSK
jgi:hypothetical protein